MNLQELLSRFLSEETEPTSARNGRTRAELRNNDSAGNESQHSATSTTGAGGPRNNPAGMSAKLPAPGVADNAVFEVQGHIRPVEVDLITDDSRQLTERSIFAITELSYQHLESALQRNPALIIAPRNLMADSRLQDFKARGAVLRGLPPARSRPEWILSRLAGILHDHPDRKLTLVAVTGTNGKTSITRMIYHAWKKAGKSCAVIGTLGATYYKDGEEVNIQTGYTTPRSYQLLELLSQMHSSGVELVALEASSEALALGRLEAIHLSKAVFCGLSVDHLDYHKTMNRYFMAKAHLFTILARSGGKAIIQDLSQIAEDRYSKRLQTYAQRLGLQKRVLSSFRDFELHVPVEFNVRNANLAWYASGLDYDPGLFKDMPDVPGRMNRIEVSPGLDAIVDYAQTPDALERILSQLKASGYDALFCVFGCGGNRDPSKRPLMGRAAMELADFVIITDDNPRKEDPASIRSAILNARELPDLRPAFADLREVADRRDAIIGALERANELAGVGKKCCVLIAGKGHEDYQIYGTQKKHFSDQEVVMEFLEALPETKQAGSQKTSAKQAGSQKTSAKQSELEGAGQRKTSADAERTGGEHEVQP